MSIDKQIFDEVNAVKVEVLKGLTSEKSFWDEQKKRFLAGSVRNPEFQYPFINLQDNQKKLETLKTFPEKIVTCGLPKSVTTLYLDHINNMEENIHLLNAVKRGDVKQFQELQDTRRALTRADAEQALLMVRNQVAQNENWKEAELLLNMLPTVHGVPLEVPSQELICFTKRHFSDHFQKVLSFAEAYTDEVYYAPQVKSAFEKLIHLYGMEGWVVEVPERGAESVSMNHITKIFTVPPHSHVSQQRLKELLLHEGFHLVRGHYGRASNLTLLGVGFPGYLECEEGLAACIEDIYRGKVDIYFGADRYLWNALAAGIIGDHAFDFREVFEVAQLYYQITLPEKNATNEAWKFAFRTFRGTDGNGGTTYTKDILYFLGNKDVWQHFRNAYEDKENIPDLFVGKYDFRNEVHVSCLKEVGIL